MQINNNNNNVIDELDEIAMEPELCRLGAGRGLLTSSMNQPLQPHLGLEERK